MNDGVSAVERLLGQQEMLRLLESIETAAWLIVGLLLVANALLIFGLVKRRSGAAQDKVDWAQLVEKAYEAAEYEKALQTLQTYELLFPRSALIKFWQGRCHFQRESWNKAAEKFEECCRLEPPYRQSVRDYMAFIELNALAPGVEGYLEK